MEQLESADGKLIAIVARANFEASGVTFLSKKDFPLQLGISCYKQGERIKPHFHLHHELLIEQIQEIVHIEQGKAIVKLYDLNGKEFCSIELAMGDTIFFVDGGHGFTILEDTKLIEVKQGPYFGKEKDKVML